ncbi:unnamed protein product [Zymoseptoria tritici ST99CH_3D1]|nr:unnamed protein product [Zymoseptoria tritici ST99CH_1E4]SMR55981.1 unnamed protein product [Zymoseptoria tritici ST99CH_3D1]
MLGGGAEGGGVKGGGLSLNDVEGGVVEGGSVEGGGVASGGVDGSAVIRAAAQTPQRTAMYRWRRCIGSGGVDQNDGVDIINAAKGKTQAAWRVMMHAFSFQFNAEPLG